MAAVRHCCHPVTTYSTLSLHQPTITTALLTGAHGFTFSRMFCKWNQASVTFLHWNMHWFYCLPHSFPWLDGSFHYQPANLVCWTMAPFNWNTTCNVLKHSYMSLSGRSGKVAVSTQHLPREFIWALKVSTFGQASRKSSGRDGIWFLLRFNIFNSFRLKGEQIPDILFLVGKHKTED